jgi:hypothetical protein
MNTKMDYDSSKVVSESGLEGRLEITSTPGLTHGKPYKASMKTALEAELPIRENVHPQGYESQLYIVRPRRDVSRSVVSRRTVLADQSLKARAVFGE